MKRPPETACREWEKLLGAYYDGELSPRENELYAEHLRSCPRCLQTHRQYQSISRSLTDLGDRVGEGASLWPAIRLQLGEESSEKRTVRPKIKFFTILRPAWIGLGLSAAAALIIFFSGVLSGDRLLENYCRIESISAPQHNLMIHCVPEDGLTIIWLTE